MHFVTKSYIKGTYDYHQLAKFFMYFFEKLYSFNNQEQIVFLIDMHDVGHKNLVSAYVRLA